jgi:hypothetical protein
VGLERGTLSLVSATGDNRKLAEIKMKDWTTGTRKNAIMNGMENEMQRKLDNLNTEPISEP